MSSTIKNAVTSNLHNLDKDPNNIEAFMFLESIRERLDKIESESSQENINNFNVKNKRN